MCFEVTTSIHPSALIEPFPAVIGTNCYSTLSVHWHIETAIHIHSEQFKGTNMSLDCWGGGEPEYSEGCHSDTGRTPGSTGHWSQGSSWCEATVLNTLQNLSGIPLSSSTLTFDERVNINTWHIPLIRSILEFWKCLWSLSIDPFSTA